MFPASPRASPALVDGGTEVVLQVSSWTPPDAAAPRVFTVQWQSGGPGVVKGVASLPRDMQEALGAGLLRASMRVSSPPSSSSTTK